VLRDGRHVELCGIYFVTCGALFNCYIMRCFVFVGQLASDCVRCNYRLVLTRATPQGANQARQSVSHAATGKNISVCVCVCATGTCLHTGVTDVIHDVVK